MSRHIVVLGGALAFTALAITASAQEQSYFAQHERMPSDALELKVGTGYTQPFGNLAPSRAFNNVAGAGIGVNADVDWRFNPWWSLGVQGEYQQFNPQQNTEAKGANINIGPTYHFLPALRGDPWVRLATGYRWFWENNPPGTFGPNIWAERDGFQIITGRVGYDVRVSPDVAIAPVVGADVNLFVWQQFSDTSQHSLSSSQVATFFYAGLQGRFNIGGSRTGGEIAMAGPGVVGVTAPQPAAPPPPPAPPPEETKPVSPNLGVSEDVIRECQINLGSVEKAPKFDFNESDLLPGDIAVLDQIAKCFTTGPLKDAGLHLVGRADPRGTVHYNDELGMRRSNAVAAYLEKMGLDSSRIDQMSRGKREARGHNEETWAVDRRVDVFETH